MQRVSISGIIDYNKSSVIIIKLEIKSDSKEIEKNAF